MSSPLGEQGHATVTINLRGPGASSGRAGRGGDFGYREIVETELRALFWIGHSLGGHLAYLYVAIAP